MAVRGKLWVSAVKRQGSTPDAAEVTLSAVTRGEENKSWAEASPSATFVMQIQNPHAAAQFSLGQEFYVDFIPAEPVTTLATPHDYEPSDYEKEHPDHTYGRCAACGAKRVSHDEPLRSMIVQQAGLK